MHLNVNANAIERLNDDWVASEVSLKSDKWVSVWTQGREQKSYWVACACVGFIFGLSTRFVVHVTKERSHYICIYMTDDG